MKRADKTNKILEILDELYPSPRVPLNHVDPFSLLVATVLSAQCTDVRVNKTMTVLMKMADTAQKMMMMEVDVIQDVIRSCGLSANKSKAIKGLSEIIVNQHNEKVPDTFDELEALPGVGHKTASVVMAQAFNQPAFPVDTHIHRLAKRWKLSSGKSVTQTEKDLKRLFPKKHWNKLHLQMIYFGREYCPARGHDLNLCPICSWI